MTKPSRSSVVQERESVAKEKNTFSIYLYFLNIVTTVLCRCTTMLYNPAERIFNFKKKCLLRKETFVNNTLARIKSMNDERHSVKPIEDVRIVDRPFTS